MAKDVLKARRAEARGLPDEAPIEAVESIPLVGRTWYTRRTRYYLLRAWGAFMGLLVFTIATLFEAVLFQAAAETQSSVGRRIAIGLLVIALIGSFVAPTRRTVRLIRLRRSGQLLIPDYSREGRQNALRGRSWGLGAGMLGALVSTLLFYGWFAYWLFWTLQRETDIEHDARLRLQRRARRNPNFEPEREPGHPYHR